MKQPPGALGVRLAVLFGQGAKSGGKASRVDLDTLMLLELVFMSLADYIHHLYVVISSHLALPMTCWHLWLYVAEAVRLFALG